MAVAVAVAAEIGVGQCRVGRELHAVPGGGEAGNEENDPDMGLFPGLIECQVTRVKEKKMPRKQACDAFPPKLLKQRLK